MPRSGWAREPWPLSLRVRSLCSATGEATTVRGPCTGKKKKRRRKEKKLPTNLGRAKENRINRDKRIGPGPAPVGGSREGETVSTHQEPLRGRRLRVAEGESFGAAEETAATGVRRAKQRDSRTEDRCRPPLTSPRGFSPHPPGRAGLGAEARASVRAHWRREHSLKGVSAPRPAGRESGEKSGAAEEAGDFSFPLCFLVREERGFRALLKGGSRDGREARLKARTPETGVGRWGCCCRHQEARVRAQVTLHTSPPGSLCCPPPPRSRAPQTTSPGERTGAPRADATSRRPPPTHARPASVPLPPPRPEGARAPESAAPLTPSCLSEEQTSSGDLHAEAGPNPKLSPGSCANKEDKGESLPAASEAAD